MSTIDPSLEMGLPELAHGSVWLVSAGDRDPRRRSQSIRSARRTR